jgi:hypothetical protein
MTPAARSGTTIGNSRDGNAYEAFRHERHVTTQANRLVAKLILRRGAINEPLTVLWFIGANSTHQFNQSSRQRFEPIASYDEGHTKGDRKYRPTAHRVTPHDSKGSIAQFATGNL